MKSVHRIKGAAHRFLLVFAKKKDGMLDSAEHRGEIINSEQAETLPPLFIRRDVIAQMGGFVCCRLHVGKYGSES